MPDTMLPTAAAQSISPAIPVEIAQAIGSVMTQIKSLPKGERNAHGGYDFASIDNFLAAVGPLCSSAGLLVFQDEDTVDMIDRGGKAWLKITYAFHLGHVSGVVYDRPTKRTVFQSITGPQTTGSSQSYAFKMFLRSLFMIPTGDRDDADYVKPQDMPAAQDPQKPPQRVEQPRSNQPPFKAPQATQRLPVELSAPVHTPLVPGNGKQWVSDAWDTLSDCPVEWRRRWLDLHRNEMEQIREKRPDLAASLEDLANEHAEAAE
jgi:hypothetical protein